MTGEVDIEFTSTNPVTVYEVRTVKDEFVIAVFCEEKANVIAFNRGNCYIKETIYDM